MLKRFHIDQLLVFFLLSISAMLLAFGKSVVGIENTGGTQLVRYLEPQPMVSVPQQGFFTALEESVFAYNPNYDIFYSIDGGANFLNGGSSVSLMEIENPDLTYVPSSHHWKRPTGKFPQSKNVIIYLKHQTRSIVTESIYLTYFEKQQSDLPVLSMTLNIADIIGEYQGLFIFGEQSWYDEGFYNTWWSRNANFQMRGNEWERPAHIQYYEKGQLKFQDNCGIKISGNATRGFPQKSFQLVARKKYGSEFLDYPFFGKSGNQKSRSVVVRNSGNDNTKTLFADLLMHTLAKDSYVVSQAGYPTVVYLNGNYWGIYNIRERIDPYYLAQMEDVNEDEITLLEGLELKDGDDGEKLKFDALIERLSGADEATDELMSAVENEIDLNSFTDYIIFETYYANTDWPENNSLCYKSKDGKWKWILHDLDYGLAYLGASAVDQNLFENLKSSVSPVAVLFNFLIQDEAYKKRFQDRVQVLLNTCLSESNVTVVFQNLSQQYRSELSNQINRWRMIDSFEAWEENCRLNLIFLSNRGPIYKKQLESLE